MGWDVRKRRQWPLNPRLLISLQREASPGSWVDRVVIQRALELLKIF